MTKPHKDRIDGLTRLAAVIAEHFGIPCVKQDISKWQKFSPPFPSPIPGSNRYKIKECLDWVEAYWLPKKRPAEDQKELFLRAERARAETDIKKAEKITVEVAVLEKKYIERAAAEQTAKGAAKKYHNFVKLEIERLSPDVRRDKLKALGCPVEILAVFYEFDLALAISVIDRIETECAKYAG